MIEPLPGIASDVKSMLAQLAAKDEQIAALKAVVMDSDDLLLRLIAEIARLRDAPASKQCLRSTGQPKEIGNGRV